MSQITSIDFVFDDKEQAKECASLLIEHDIDFDYGVSIENNQPTIHPFYDNFEFWPELLIVLKAKYEYNETVFDITE